MTDATQTSDFTLIAGCACPLCAAPETVYAAVNADAAGIVQLDAQGFLLDVSNPLSGLVGATMSNGMTVLSAYESAMQIARPGGSWADYTLGLSVTYTFDATLIGDGYAAFSAEYQAVTRDILDRYEEFSGLTFVEATDSATANILFKNIVGQYGGGGWASYPSSGTVHNAIGYPWTEGDIYAGSYVYNTILHEVGHSVGLAHPGYYNGSVDYLTQSVSWNDTRQYSVMSYNSASITGSYTAGSAATLMLHDILALQIEYGANYNTRAGNTTYGFNSNTGRAAYTFSADDNTSAFSIWDGAGMDTLDFSGFASDTVMDLRQGGFSSTGIETYNISIAYGAVIENAIGGAGDDKIRGNEVGNKLSGGAGNDALYGGEEAASLPLNRPQDFLGIALNDAALESGQYLARAGLSALSGAAFSLEMMISLTRLPASTTAFFSYAVSGNANELLLEGTTDGTLRLTLDGLASYDTGLLTRSLADGAPHRLSLTWAAETGTVSLYIDGALAHQGVYTAAIGRVLGSGGTLIIGQEQDSLGGGFSAAQDLEGVVGDIRVFALERTAAEIAASAFGTVAPDAAGLMHNWVVSAQDSATIRDLAQANPAVNLTDLAPERFSATQSSNYNASSGAAYVLDNSATSFNHTLNSGAEWLLISFTEPMSVAYIELLNRPTWGSRLNGATVSVLDATGAVLYTSAPITDAASGAVLTILLPEMTRASAVRIDQTTNVLHLAEVDIYGTAPEGVEVPAALLNTDMTISGGEVVETAPLVALAADNDTLTGGAGADTLMGGAGNDSLLGDSAGFVARAAQDITLVALNTGTPASGTTDQWLDQTAAFAMPTSALTLEMLLRFEANAADGATIFGYANGDDSNWKRFTLRAWSDTLDFYFFDNTLYNTDIPASAFTGDQAVRLSVAWSSAEGVVRFYLDGVLADEVAVPAGVALTAGWQFWTMSGAGSVIEGAVGDIRVWDHARTQGEIAADAWTSYSGAQAGLVANWQAVAGSATLANTAGTAAAALSVQNITAENPLAFETAAFTAANNDLLIGGAGNDRLNGGAGADTMQGGAGNDIYYVDQASDLVEEAAGAGSDLIYATVDYALTETSAVEKLYAYSNAGLALSGNALKNTITGKAGADSLAGGAGNDRLTGGLGADVLSGGLGTDTFVFTAADAPDQITDFAADRLRFDASAFGGMAALGLGALSADEFVFGAVTAAHGQFSYDAASGALAFDADGTGAQAAALLAILSNHADLSAAWISLY